MRNTAAGRIDKRPRNGFSSAAALLLPGRLYAAGYSREAALQTIGVLNSVAVPLVVLPMAFAGAVAAVCMPAVSAAVQNNNKICIELSKISRGTDFCRCGESFASAFFEETVRTSLQNRSGLGRVYSADAEILHNTFSNSNDSDTERPKGAENRACVHRLSEGLQLILIYLFAALPQLHIYGCLAAMAAGKG